MDNASLSTPPPAWETNVEVDGAAQLIDLDLEATMASALEAADRLPRARESAWARFTVAEVLGHRGRPGKLLFRLKFAEVGGPEGMWVPLGEILLVEAHKPQVAAYLRALQAKRTKAWPTLVRNNPELGQLIQDY